MQNSTLTKPFCSLVITTYNASAHLKCCVASIARFSSTDASLIEVILYGDGGGAQSEIAIQESVSLLVAAGFVVRACYNPQNQGIVLALNAACKMASGVWLFVMNDDMVFPQNWLSLIIEHLLPRRVLSLRCIEPMQPGRTSAACFVVKTLGRDPLNFDFVKLDEFNSEIIATEAQKQVLVKGVNYPFFVERDLFFEVGAADPRFSGPYHDPDLFYRLYLAGAELVRLNWPLLYHFSGISLRFGDGGFKVTKNWIQKENIARLEFVRKWGVKPKAKFGEIPKMKVSAPLSQRSLGFWERIFFVSLLFWEKVRCKFRELRYDF